MSDRNRLIPPGGVAGRLVNQIAALITLPGLATLFPVLTIEAATVRPWTSATFEGERHRLDLRLHGDVDTIGDALDRLIDALPEAEFDLPGQIVADAKLTSLRIDPDPLTLAAALIIEILTVVD